MVKNAKFDKKYWKYLSECFQFLWTPTWGITKGIFKNLPACKTTFISDILNNKEISLLFLVILSSDHRTFWIPAGGKALSSALSACSHTQPATLELLCSELQEATLCLWTWNHPRLFWAVGIVSLVWKEDKKWLFPVSDFRISSASSHS